MVAIIQSDIVVQTAFTAKYYHTILYEVWGKYDRRFCASCRCLDSLCLDLRGEQLPTILVPDYLSQEIRGHFHRGKEEKEGMKVGEMCGSMEKMGGHDIWKSWISGFRAVVTGTVGNSHGKTPSITRLSSRNSFLLLLHLLI